MSKLNCELITEHFRRHSDEFCTYVCRRIPRRLRSLIQPEDVLQEAYMDACRSAGSFQGDDPRGLVRWLQRIVVRRLAQQIRTLSARKRIGRHDVLRGRWPNMDSDAAGLTKRTPSKEISKRESLAIISQRIHDLTEQRRMAIELFFLKQQSLTSVGQQLNCSKNAGRSLIFQACKQLRSWLGSASHFLSSSSRS